MNWNQFFRDFFDFIAETFGLIADVVEETGVWARDNVIMAALNITRDAAQEWYRRAGIYSFWSLIVITILTIISIGADIALKNGVVSAILGIIIAIPLLFVLIYWTPLVAVIGGVVSLLKLEIKATPKTAMQYSTTWLNICLVIVFWQLIISFFMSWIPFWQRLVSVPIIILASLILALMGAVWKKTFWYRTVIATVVIVILFANIVACFSPRFYNSFTRFAGANLEYFASKLEQWSTGSEVESFYSKWIMEKNYGDIIAGTVVRIKSLEFTEKGAEKMVKAFLPNSKGLYIEEGVPVPFAFLKPADQAVTDSGTQEKKILRSPEEKIVHFMPGQPTNTKLSVQMGDKVEYINPTSPFKVPGTNQFHEISSTTEHDATGIGTIVIYGDKKEGYVQIKITPKNS